MPVNILAPYLLTALVYRAQRRIYLSSSSKQPASDARYLRDSEPSDVPDLMGTLVQTGSKKKAKGPRTRSSRRSSRAKTARRRASGDDRDRQTAIDGQRVPRASRAHGRAVAQAE